MAQNKKPTDKSKRKRGRPTKFNPQIHEKILELARKGKTNAEIAEIIGVNEWTIYEWQRHDVDFSQTLKEAKQVADDLVEASLFKKATGYTHPEEKIFCSEGQIVRAETIKHYPPDTIAGIFWLKNRRPDKWRDQVEPPPPPPPKDDTTVVYTTSWGTTLEPKKEE